MMTQDDLVEMEETITRENANALKHRGFTIYAITIAYDRSKNPSGTLQGLRAISEIAYEHALIELYEQAASWSPKGNYKKYAALLAQAGYTDQAIASVVPMLPNLEFDTNED